MVRKPAHRRGRSRPPFNLPKTSAFHKSHSDPPEPAAAKTAASASKQAKPAAKARKPEARDGSEKSAVLDLLRRKEGETAAKIAKVTKWQVHSIRGFISGTVSKKMKLTVESVRNDQGERVYKVK